MRAIMVKNFQIVSLEKVREVKLNEFGTGAKSNPHYWSISVKYEDNKEVTINNDFKNKEEVLEVFNAIFAKLTVN